MSIRRQTGPRNQTGPRTSHRGPVYLVAADTVAADRVRTCELWVMSGVSGVASGILPESHSRKSAGQDSSGGQPIAPGYTDLESLPANGTDMNRNTTQAHVSRSTLSRSEGPVLCFRRAAFGPIVAYSEVSTFVGTPTSTPKYVG